MLKSRSTFKLTIGEMLSRPLFQDAQVIAGKDGLQRMIKWVHIMEVTEIGQLLNGNELILTTGVGWQKQKQTSLSFLKQLIDGNVAGLCIELGTYTSEVPDEMIELAEHNQFPLIVFRKEVRFIDITQEINGILMDNHYKMISDLEEISHKLNQILLLPDAFKRILRYLHQVLDVQVICAHRSDKDIIFMPDVAEDDKPLLKDTIQPFISDNIIEEKTHPYLARQPIQAMGHIFADLLILSENHTFSEFELLVLDRASTALAQDLLRMLYVEEKKKVQENQWAKEWRDGKYEEEDIHYFLSSTDPSLKPNGCVAAVCSFKSIIDESDLTYYFAVFRSIFKQQGFYSLMTFEANQMVFLLINKRGKNDWKQRVRQAVDQIKRTEQIGKSDKPSMISAGKLFEKLNQMHVSYNMAINTQRIQQKANLNDRLFYEDLHIYRLISLVHKHSDLENFAKEYLMPVIEHDQLNNGNLLETLKVLLESNGSKKEAADRLFIVRQTLYHRVEKLKKLLGSDFMKSEKRLAIEFALYVDHYLQKDQEI